MLQRILAFIGFVFLLIVGAVQSNELFLSFYVFFPALLFPALFFQEDNYRPLLLPASILIFIFYFLNLVRFPSFEILFLGVGYLGMAAGFWNYKRNWRRVLVAETGSSETSQKELGALNEKHHARLESLHHLEKQVSGLLDLYEIARDFNDYLSFEGTVQILHQRVMPELPFQQMRLILLEKNQDKTLTAQKIYEISSGGVREFAGAEDLSPKELRWLAQIKETKKMIQQDGDLMFPLVIDSEVSACLIVYGSLADDLAKFEVLVAYLTLQVKKIRLYETVKELSIRDSLTDVFVRRHFLQRFDEELKRAIKYNLPLAVLMLDIDLFKRYNDDYGHLAGDATLKQVAGLLKENLRKVDIVGRYGGEEFVVVLPEVKKAVAHEVAERIRSNIARTSFKIYNDQTRVTVSIGVALFPNDTPDWQSKTNISELAFDLIRHADKALYRSKEDGRNRVAIYEDL